MTRHAAVAILAAIVLGFVLGRTSHAAAPRPASVPVDDWRTVEPTWALPEAPHESRGAAGSQPGVNVTGGASFPAVPSTEPTASVAASRPGTPRPTRTPTIAAAKSWALGKLGATQYRCLDVLVQRESGWNVTARNASTGAYGLPQSLPGSKMAAAGADWRTNPITQLRWMVGIYVPARYGTVCRALSHSYAAGWY